MALNFTTSSANKALFGSIPKYSVPAANKDLSKLSPSFFLSSSSATNLRSSEGNQARVTTEEDVLDSASDDVGLFTATRAQLGLLEQLTSSGTSGYESDSGSSGNITIREQLAQLVGFDRDDDFIIPLGKKNLKKMSPKFLTISQKRNIKRQAYLNEVSKRNDSVFFATIGAFVLLPPVVILGIAISTGYVQLFP